MNRRSINYRPGRIFIGLPIYCFNPVQAIVNRKNTNYRPGRIFTGFSDLLF